VVSTCRIDYTIRNSNRKKGRTLDEGKSFNFGHDIISLKYDGKVIDTVDILDKIFGLMDTGASGFTVTPSFFGVSKASGDAKCEMPYHYESGKLKSQTKSNGED
jgi:hypothetical protein